MVVIVKSAMVFPRKMLSNNKVYDKCFSRVKIDFQKFNRM